MTHAATVSAGASVQRAQWDRRHIAAAPVNADPDVIRDVRALAALRRIMGEGST